MLRTHVSPHVVPKGIVGSADFNLTLVNKMEPNATGMKRENDYGMGKISVGWHRDSGLKDFSSIAVYQRLSSEATRKNDGELSSSTSSWGVALRAMDGGSGGPLPTVPPLLVPLPSGSVYYMLDEFNHNHEHAVISPSLRNEEAATRYSSTHRVAREGRGTWQYLRDKARGIRRDSSTTILTDDNSAPSVSGKKCRKILVSRVRAEQNLITEIEFEWLRQWHVQGQRHASLHPYWHGPIRELCDIYRELEKATSEILDVVSSQNGSKGRNQVVTEDLFDVLIESMTERSTLRATWHERYRDPIYADIPEDERPFPCDCLVREKEVEKEGRLPEDLDALVSQLRRSRSVFVSAEKSDEQLEGAERGDIMMLSKKKCKRDGEKSKSGGSLTKKESKQRASNWERLKASLKR